MSPKRKGFQEHYAKLGRAISQFVVDPQVGICLVHPWRGRKSGYAGPQVMQIVTESRLSKLETRSLETLPDGQANA